MKVVRVKEKAIILPILADFELELKGFCPHSSHLHNLGNLQNLDFSLRSLVFKPDFGNNLQM